MCAHEIYEIGDGYSMAYVNDVPWHGLGQKLDENAPIEVWAKEAHLDWEYNEAMVKWQEDCGFFPGIKTFGYPERKVIYRSDTRTPLSVVSADYHVVQPAEVLEFYRDLIAENGFVMDTAGSLMEGRKVWALARVGKDFSIDGDEIKSFLLLATSCDRSLATTAQFTAVRVVCNNTLSLAYNKGNRGIENAVRQCHSMKFNPKQMKIEMGLVEDMFQNFRADVYHMKNTRIDDRTAMFYIMSVVSGKEVHSVVKEEDIEKPRLVKAMFESYKKAPGAEDTAWGLLNAVTYHNDHVRGRSNDTRLNSAWFGLGAAQKQRAYEKAVALAA